MFDFAVMVSMCATLVAIPLPMAAKCAAVHPRRLVSFADVAVFIADVALFVADVALLSLSVGARHVVKTSLSG